MRVNIKKIAIWTCAAALIVGFKYIDYEAQNRMAYAEQFVNPIGKADRNGNAPVAAEANTENITLYSDYNIPDMDLSKVSNVYDIVAQEANLIDLRVDYANVLIDAESSFRTNAHNDNVSKKKIVSYDSGLAQLNNGGDPLLHFMGKTLTLADGRKVTVNIRNYKTDVRLNVAIGLRKYKEYLKEVGGCPFAAYAVYNIGPDAKRYVTGKRGPIDVITAVRKHNNQGANNLKNNYWVKYKKWMGANG